MKRFLTISPREGSEPRAATSATSGTGSSCHFAAATSTKRKFDNANYDKEKRKRTFQDQWFGEFAWLRYTSGNDTMACNVCRKFTRLSDPKSALVLGTNKFRKYPLYKHEKSTCRIACVNHQCYLDSKGKLGSATSTAIGRGILALHGVKAVKYLSEFEAIVKTIYLFYHYSPKRRRELTEIATVLDVVCPLGSQQIQSVESPIKEPALNLCPCGACISKQQACR